MKILYIYCTNLNKETPANTLQTLNMLNAFGKKNDLTYVSVWISKIKLSNLLDFFCLDKNFKNAKLPIIFSTYSLSLEKWNRALYCTLALAISKLKDYDLIYTRDFSFLYYLSLIPQVMRPKQPIVFEPHNILHKVSPKISLEQEKKGMRMADLYIPTTEGSKQDLQNIFNVSDKKILVQPNAVNLELFLNTEKQAELFYRKYPTTTDSKIIVYTGSFQNWKGVDILVKAIKYVKTQRVKFMLVGGSGEDKKKIEELGITEKVSEQLIIEGSIPQKEMIHALKNADIAVIPNINMPEGMRYTSPLKTYEYMAVGLPIIASDLFAMRQLLKENENCLFFEPENERALAEKIDDLLQDDTLRNFMSEKNQLKAKDYGWNQRAENIRNFICKKLQFIRPN